MANIIIPDDGTIGSTSDTDALTITNAGVVKASQSIATSTIKDATGTNNSISIATNGEATFAENLKITNGKGIDFSAVSGSAGGSSSALLDDYEEGSWTPTGTNVGTSGGDTSVGRYIKIGTMVHLQGWIKVVGGSTTNAMGGLPFTADSVGNAQGGGSTMFQNSDTHHRQYGLLVSGTTFYIYDGDATTTLGNNSQIHFQISYKAT